jgi:hypothetical protein
MSAGPAMRRQNDRAPLWRDRYHPIGIFYRTRTTLIGIIR